MYSQIKVLNTWPRQGKDSYCLVWCAVDFFWFFCVISWVLVTCVDLLWFFVNHCRLLRIFWSFYNTSHKFWDQSPSPHCQCCFQVFETVPWHKLPCCYSSNILQHWVGGRDLIYSCKLDQPRIFINFSMNWLGLINLCEILKFAVHNWRLLLEGCWGKKN